MLSINFVFDKFLLFLSFYYSNPSSQSSWATKVKLTNNFAAVQKRLSNFCVYSYTMLCFNFCVQFSYSNSSFHSSLMIKANSTCGADSVSIFPLLPCWMVVEKTIGFWPRMPHETALGHVREGARFKEHSTKYFAGSCTVFFQHSLPTWTLYEWHLNEF